MSSAATTASNTPNLGTSAIDKAAPTAFSEASLKKEPTIAAAVDSDLRAWAFTSDAIGAERWNRHYPYQFIVLEKNETGDGWTPLTDWSFALPIPPSSLSIAPRIASTLRPLAENGVVEERSPTRFYDIAASGTFGTNLGRTSAGQDLPEVPFVLKSTVMLAQGINDSVQAILDPNPRFNIMAVSEANSVRTGYYQFRLMQKFLEGWLSLSAGPLGKNLSLGLAMWKDESVYLIKMEEFRVSRDSSSPLAYNYSIRATAWGRTSLKEPNETSNKKVSDPQLTLARIADDLQLARSVLERSRLIVQGLCGDVSALYSDFVTPFTATFPPLAAAEQVVLRTVGAYAKQAAGKSLAVADLGVRMVQDLTVHVLDSVFGQSDPNTAVGQTRTEKALETRGRLLDDPYRAYLVYSRVNPKALSINSELRQKLDQELATLAAIRRVDLERFRDRLYGTYNNYVDAIGLGATPSSRKVRDFIEEDMEIMEAMQSACQSVEALLLLTRKEQDMATPLAMDYVAGLAGASGIAFQKPTSKIAVPFPRHATLETLARDYLGDFARWHEIATLNGLRPPFVDEQGITLSLLSDGGDSDRVFVPFGNKDLYVGQKVTIGSNTELPTAYRIVGLTDQGTSGTIVQLNTEVPKEVRVSDDAYLHYFSPGTVNSSQLIYIPSDLPVNSDFVNPETDSSDAQTLLDRGGQDILLNGEGDIVVEDDGTTRWASGMQSLIQKVNIALNCPKGSLLLHPQFGFPVQVGANGADVDPQEVAASIREMFASDPDLDGVKALRVVKRGVSLSVDTTIGVKEVNQVLPLNFEIK